MKIHFIAIGGSAMHNLAIALKLKGYEITGSDDEEGFKNMAFCPTVSAGIPTKSPRIWMPSSWVCTPVRTIPNC